MEGLSYYKLGNKAQAKKIFENLISEANRQLEQSSTDEVGVIFGERESDKDRQSILYLIRGLGHKGLGDNEKAKDDIDKSLAISQSNLWAKVEQIH